MRPGGFLVRSFGKVFQLGIVMALAGCAAGSREMAPRDITSDPGRQEIAADLLEGRPERARELLAGALRTQPGNGYLHLLNGLSYEIEGNSSQASGLARVGYDAAVKFTPESFWAQYLAGQAAFDDQNYGEAAEHFAASILDDPDQPRAFLGLAISSYYSGDLEVARVAADRALQLEPSDPLALRTAAFVAAAGGDAARVHAVTARAESLSSTDPNLAGSNSRLGQVLRMASWNERDAGVEPPDPGDSDATRSGDSKQVMVEVTVLLNQASTVHNTGINLLDGLLAQFGVTRLTDERRVTGLPTTITRSFTTALGVPQIAYSLNLFNTKNDYYRVIARPSLVAYLDQSSEFFIGRTVTVAVSGINAGAIAPIDVGTSVRLVPSEITPTHVRFRIDVNRSFLAAEAGGTFSQSLTTFKQVVGATAEVDFGSTLILSSLYEGVDVRSDNKTPVLGDTPVLGTVFNARTRTERRDVALVLVTPTVPGSIETSSGEFRGETLQKLLSLWKDLIDPVSNMDSILKGLGRRSRPSKHFRTVSGDLRLPSISDPRMLQAAVSETIAELH